MIQLLDNELLSRIALILAHFLWQGAAVGAIAAISALVLRRSSAAARYAVHTAALLCLPACVAVTFAAVEIPAGWPDSGAEMAGLRAFQPGTQGREPHRDGMVPSDSPQLRTFDDPDGLSPLHSRSESNELLVAEGTAIAVQRAGSSLPSLFARFSPAVALTYVAGVMLFLLRLLAGTWGGHRLRVASVPIDHPSLLELVSQQSRRVGLRIVPVVAVCERVAVPMVVGVLRPVVLLPASIVSGLAPEQFAAIISHELAHIRRFDLLLNLLQRLVESLLFFHPVVWYISRRMSAEREACCDDLVVSCGYPPMDYAGALLQMAELCSPRVQPSAVAVAASGHSVSLFERRILRLLNTQAESRLRLTRVGGIMIALLMISVAVTPAVFRNWAQAQDATGLARPVTISDPQQSPEHKAAEPVVPAAAGSPTDVEERDAANAGEAEGRLSPKVNAAIAKGAVFLESTQQDSGLWNIGQAGWHNDGATALCALALLRAGRTAEDEGLKRAVDYLVTVRPEHTYLAALQTILFCELNAKQHLPHIRRNVQWLIDAQTKEGEASGGWSYGSRSARSDGSNTRFAVWALDVAQRAGVEVPNDTWHLVADYWLGSQLESGAWPYHSNGIPRSPNMTLAGIASLSVARPFASAEGEERRRKIDASIQRAWKWHDETKRLLERWRTILYRFYGLQTLALAGDRTDRVANDDWYPRLAALLLREQDRSKGGWFGSGPEGPAVATSLAILALTEPQAGRNRAPEGGAPAEKVEPTDGKTSKEAVRRKVELYERSFLLQTELATSLPTTREDIERIYQRVFGRQPSDEEVSATMKSVLNVLSRASEQPEGDTEPQADLETRAASPPQP